MVCKRYLAVVLSLMVVLSGCGIKEEKSAEVSGHTVVDSEGTTIQVWTVAEMDISETEVYEGRVTPYAEKLCFSGEGQFGEYLVNIGDEVKKGQKLARTMEEEETLEVLQKESVRLQEDFQYQLQNLEKQLEIGELKLQCVYDELELAVNGTEEYTRICEKAGVQDQENKKLQLKITQLTEKYQLEKTWKDKQLQEYRDRLGKNVITAPFDGVVTNMLPCLQGQELDWKSAYMAVADTTRYQVVCDYIGQNNMNGLERAYAIIGGQEYELTHVPYEEDDYRAIRAAQEDCYSFFEVQNSESISFGDYAVVVTVQDSVQQALAVPALSVQRDSGGTFVYRMEDGEKNKIYIETGVFDGVYYEVVHGLNEGDEIYVALEGDVLPNKGGNEIPRRGPFSQGQEAEPEEQAISDYLNLEALEAVRQGDKSEAEYETQILEKGDFVVDWKKTAAISVAQQKVVTAEYDTGIMYFDAFTVGKYDYVEAGQPIATVRVEIDTIALAEKERKLQRLKERYARDEEAFYEEREEKLAKRVWRSENENLASELQFKLELFQWDRQAVNYQQQIMELEEEIADIRKISNITEIKAPMSGYVMSLESLLQGQELKNNEIVAFMLPAEGVLLQIEDSEMDFGHGMVVSLQMGKQEEQMDCTVMCVTGKSVRGELADSVATLRAECTAQELIEGRSYTVTGAYQEIKDVILVPADAVYRENELLYVIVKTEDGKFEKRGFTAGGNSKEWYWVLSGLEEGLEVVTE